MKTRYRCKTCGVGVASYNEEKEKWSVWGALFPRDGDNKIRSDLWELIKPDAHIFYGTRMVDVNDGLEKWEGYKDISQRLNWVIFGACTDHVSNQELNPLWQSRQRCSASQESITVDDYLTALLVLFFPVWFESRGQSTGTVRISWRYGSHPYMIVQNAMIAISLGLDVGLPSLKIDSRATEKRYSAISPGYWNDTAFILLIMPLSAPLQRSKDTYLQIYQRWWSVFWRTYRHESPECLHKGSNGACELKVSSP